MISSTQRTSPACFDDPLSQVTSTLRNAYDSMEREKKLENDKQLFQTVMAKMSAEVADRTEAVHRRIRDDEVRVKETVDAVQTVGNRHNDLDDKCQALGNRLASTDDRLESLSHKQACLDHTTKQRLSSQHEKIQEQGRIIEKLQREVGRMHEQDRIIGKLQRGVRQMHEQDGIIGGLRGDVEFLMDRPMNQPAPKTRVSPDDGHMDATDCPPRGPLAMMLPGSRRGTPSRYNERDRN